MNRKSVFSGYFYPKEEKELKNLVKGFIKERKKETNYIIVPHAGFIYSGETAGRAYSLLKKQNCFVIIGPNHTGQGPEISLSNADYWVTPLGKIKVEKNITKKITKSLGIDLDEKAHEREHSIEVQLPFLQYLFKEKISIIPIIVSTSFEKRMELAEVLSELNTGIIISSDFNHFKDLKQTKKDDFKAIELIKKLDLVGFEEFVLREKQSICGFQGIEIMMKIAKKKELKAKLVYYSTSAKKTKKKESVVGYAGIIFK